MSTRRPPAAAAPDAPPIVARFAGAAFGELGLSRNTLAAYRSDLAHFARHLAARGIALEVADRAEIYDYLALRLREGYRARSNARLLSCLRHFYRWLLREGAVAADPTALVESPKLPRGLPKAPGEREVEALLAAPDIAAPEGLRDRAMLELLYATGLRVGELVGLRVDEVNLRQGALRVCGKGGKQRLVPIGDEAQHWLSHWLAEGRPALLGRRTMQQQLAAGPAPTLRQRPQALAEKPEPGRRQGWGGEEAGIQHEDAGDGGGGGGCGRQAQVVGQP